MRAMLLSILCLLVITLSTVSSQTSPAFQPDLVHSELRSYTDISTHIEETTVYTKLTNNATSGAPIGTYYIIIPNEHLTHLSFIDLLPSTAATAPTLTAASFQRIFKDDERSNKLRINQRPAPPALPARTQALLQANSPVALGNLSFFAVTLPTPLSAGQSVSLLIFISYTRTLTPLPASKQQNDPQLVLYTSYAQFFTPYPVVTQRHNYKLQSSRIESYTPKKSGHVNGDSIEFGPFVEVQPFTAAPLTIHYENNAAFMTMLKLSKEIEVSEWGNIAITEKYTMKHTGALLTGPFSRLEYQKNVNNAPASYNLLTSRLPYYITDIYYRDVIGNVSTSHVRRDRRETVIEIQPRFPMFGGWESDFEVGYNIPATKQLFLAADDKAVHYLNVSFGSMFPTAAVDSCELRVILPEGTTDIEWATPFDVDSVDYSLHFTHLDTTGRPVLILRKANVVRYHHQIFTVKYHFASYNILREPLVLFAAFMGFLILAMVYYRVELGVGSEEK